MDAYTKNIMVANLVRERCDEETGHIMDIAFDPQELYQRGLRYFYNCKLDENMAKAMKYAREKYNHDVYRLVKKVDVIARDDLLLYMPNVKNVTIHYWQALKNLIPEKTYELVEFDSDHKMHVLDSSYLDTPPIKWLIHVEDFDIPSNFDHSNLKIENVISVAENVLKVFPKTDILSSTIPAENILTLSRPLRAFMFVKEYMGCNSFYEPPGPVKLYVINFKMLPKIMPREELEVLIIYLVTVTDFYKIFVHLGKFQNLKHLILIIDRPMVFKFGQDYVHTFNVYISINKYFYAVYDHIRLEVDILRYVEQIPKSITLLGIENYNFNPWLYIARLVYHFLK